VSRVAELEPAVDPAELRPAHADYLAALHAGAADAELEHLADEAALEAEARP
jgi:hypothetical protein